METFADLQRFFTEKNYRLILVADGEPVVNVTKKDKIVQQISPGGVSIVLEPIARASRGTYIARAKTAEDKTNLDKYGKTLIKNAEDSYTLKRLFFSPEDFDNYYNGFANQTLWPLCHVAFEKPRFHNHWYDGYKKVNKKFASAIEDEIKGKTFIWIHDYHLPLVPKYLGHPKNSIVAFFWHTPWPTWEVFRILPQKKEILESLLSCDFIAFHRGYHMRNFFMTVGRELEARIDRETNRIYYGNHQTTVMNLPLGIDTETIKSLVEMHEKKVYLQKLVPQVASYQVLLGVDRLDYTKGLPNRLWAIDAFFQKYPHYIGKVIYLSLLSPSREKIPSYQQLKKEVVRLRDEINQRYATATWQPVHLLFMKFSRKDIVNFFREADVCLVTPLDDGMNLVSKEFVMGSSLSQNPGMLVLSQFAGSAIDLTEALIVNPYNTFEVADAIKKALEMPPKEKQKRISSMAATLQERNVYQWAKDFLRSAEGAVINKKS